MRGRRRALAAVLAGAVAASMLVAGQASANHAGSVSVQVGDHLEGLNGESMRFFVPGNKLKVHRGDAVTFVIHSDHTASLLPANVGAQDWLDDNAFGLDKQYAFVVNDDEAGEIIDNFRNIDLPSDPSCGGATQPACTYDGSELVHSGTVFEQPAPPDGNPPESFTFKVEVNAQVGDFIWVVCLMHPHMRMKIEVVANNAAVTTQAEIDTAKTTQLALDQEWAEATHAKYKAKRTSHVTADGTRVVDAWAGVDNHHASLNHFYPRKLVVKKGQKVRWHFSDLVYGDHTVSMPIPTVFADPTFFGGAECDSPTGPDQPATLSDPNDPFSDATCPQGTTLEYEHGDLLTGRGDNVWKGMNDVAHSGVRGANVGPYSPPLNGTAPFDVKFAKTTSDKGFQYLCFIHDRMGGRIVVQ